MAFCKTVWSGVHILPSGDVRLCSINNDATNESGVGRDSSGNIVNILTHDFSQALNTDKHIAVRSLDLQDESAWHSMCSCCEHKELATNSNRDPDAGFVSRRFYLDAKVQTDLNESNFKEYSSNGLVSHLPSSLDLRFGNLCNQACVQCGPFYSNKWYADWEVYGKPTGWGPSVTVLSENEFGKIVKENEVRWWESDIWWNKFEQLLPNLTHIYLTGGEPMVVSEHERLLDTIIDAGYADCIFLEYDSNCTAIKSNLFDKWAKFKSVHIRASMDAIQDQYELIRYGGKWSTFTNNIKKIQDLTKDTNGRVSLTAVSACYQMSTLLSMVESEQWCKDNGFKFHMRFVDSPFVHSVNYLPPNAKKELIDFYSKYPDSPTATTISNYLAGIKDQWQLNHVADYINFMDSLDKKRGTNWKETLPDVWNFLKKYKISFTIKR
jgi:organic radical activating enzyme